MSIFDKLQEVREKPIEKRKKILFVSMVISMTLVVILWLGLLTFNTEEGEAASSKGPSPWRVLTNSFSGTKDEIKNTLPMPSGEVYLRE